MAAGPPAPSSSPVAIHHGRLTNVQPPDGMVVVGDFNSDHLDDIAVAETGEQNVVVLLNRTR